MASVGSSVSTTTKSLRQRGSSAKKKKVLFLPFHQCLPPSPNRGRTTGPPTVKATWFVRRLLGGRSAPVVQTFALVAGLRVYQSRMPFRLLVPDLVVALMMPPPVCPYSAEKAEVCTVNSCTVSGEKLTTWRATPTPVLFAPSARIAVLPGRPPPRLRL